MSQRIPLIDDSVLTGTSAHRCFPFGVGSGLVTQGSHWAEVQLTDSARTMKIFFPQRVFLRGGIQPVRSGCSMSCMARRPSVCIFSHSLISSDPRQGLTKQAPSEEGGYPTASRQLHMASRSAMTLSLASEGPASRLKSCDQTVVQTILNSQAPSSCSLHASRWKNGVNHMVKSRALFSASDKAVSADPTGC